MMPLLRDNGRWVIAGAVAGRVVELDLRRLYLHNVQLIGSSMHTRVHFRRLVDLARGGDVRPQVSSTFALVEIAYAMSSAISRPVARGLQWGQASRRRRLMAAAMRTTRA